MLSIDYHSEQGVVYDAQNHYYSMYYFIFIPRKGLLPDLIPYVLFPSIKGDVLFHVLDEVQKTSSSLMDDI